MQIGPRRATPLANATKSTPAGWRTGGGGALAEDARNLLKVIDGMQGTLSAGAKELRAVLHGLTATSGVMLAAEEWRKEQRAG